MGFIIIIRLISKHAVNFINSIKVNAIIKSVKD